MMYQSGSSISVMLVVVALFFASYIVPSEAMLAILRATYFLKSNNNNENSEIIYVDETMLPKYEPSMNSNDQVQNTDYDSFFGSGITDDMKVRILQTESFWDALVTSPSSLSLSLASDVPSLSPFTTSSDAPSIVLSDIPSIVPSIVPSVNPLSSGDDKLLSDYPSLAPKSGSPSCSDMPSITAMPIDVPAVPTQGLPTVVTDSPVNAALTELPVNVPTPSDTATLNPTESAFQILPTANLTPTKPPTTSNTSEDALNNGGSQSTNLTNQSHALSAVGAIFIVIGVALAILAIAVLLFIGYRRRRHFAASMSSNASTGGSDATSLANNSSGSTPIS